MLKRKLACLKVLQTEIETADIQNNYLVETLPILDFIIAPLDTIKPCTLCTGMNKTFISQNACICLQIKSW